MINQKQVRKLFKYSNGSLVRIVSVSGNALAGDAVGSYSDDGYLMVYINRKNYYVHRVLFLHQNGYLPKYIDHIDGNKRNNKIENLRECTRGQNNQNAGLQKNNTSGIKGVVWNKKTRKWAAQISSQGKAFYFGLFNDKDVAAQVVRIERIRLHGEFANHG